MYYEGFTDDSLIKLYEGVREALAADEAFTEIGGEGRFRVRKTPAWKLHAADLEAEMLRRGMTFEVIEWYEADHPVEEMLAPSAVPEDQEMQEPAVVPEQPPPHVEPSISQMVLASLSTVDVGHGSNPVLEHYPRHFRLAIGSGTRRAVPRCLSRARIGLMQCSKRHRYSITSSARASSVGGISIPSVFSVCRLIAISSLIGACSQRGGCGV